MMKKLQSLSIACALALTSGVVSAQIYDLTSAGVDSATVTGGTGGDAIFTTIFEQPGGTGAIDPFIRTQISGQPDKYCLQLPCEQGYNTDGREEFDTKEKGGHNWNHSILLGDIPVVTIDGVEYREFLLDMNQSEGQTEKYLLSLDELQFFTTDDPSITGYDDALNLFDTGEATLVWEMDTYLGDRSALAGEDDWIKLENCKDPGTCGSGDLDLQALIPSSVFGTDENAQVVLFNRFGDNAGSTGANAGFEEWVHRGVVSTTDNGVPEPGMLPLAFAGVLAGWATRRRRLAV
jgi:hypothetical protein